MNTYIFLLIVVLIVALISTLILAIGYKHFK